MIIVVLYDECLIPVCLIRSYFVERNYILCSFYSLCGNHSIADGGDNQCKKKRAKIPFKKLWDSIFLIFQGGEK